MGGGEAGKKAKMTPDAGEKSVSEKSQTTRTCRNPFEKSKSKECQATDDWLSDIVNLSEMFIGQLQVTQRD